MSVSRLFGSSCQSVCSSTKVLPASGPGLRLAVCAIACTSLPLGLSGAPGNGPKPVMRMDLFCLLMKVGIAVLHEQMKSNREVLRFSFLQLSLDFLDAAFGAGINLGAHKFFVLSFDIPHDCPAKAAGARTRDIAFPIAPYS